MRIQFLFGLVVFSLVLSQCAPADAQWRGRGDRGGEDRDEDDDDDRRGRGGDRGGDRDRGDDRRGGGGGDGGRRGGGGGGWGNFNPEDFWKERDANKDGIIDPKELDERTRPWLRSDKPVKISELVNRFEQERGGGGRDGERDGNRDRNNNRQEEKKPLVPGFGVESEEEAKVLGFGPSEEVAENEAGNAEGSSESRTASSSGGGGITSNGYVDGVFAREDANKNGVIEGDELSNAKGLPPNADSNGDGSLTREELVKAVPSKNPAAASNSDSIGGRRSYRFASAHDRLDGSAKGWIVSRDKNFDGQVAMHEFSSTWSESKIREFQKYDSNGDGIVTAEEYESR